MSEIALRALRGEAMALRERLSAEREASLRDEAARLEDELRRVTARMLDRVCRLPVSDLVTLRQEAAGYRQELTQIAEMLGEAELEESLQSQEDLLCPLTQVVMREAVTAADGFTYDRESIRSWLVRERAEGRTRAGAARSPLTNAVLPHLDLVPNPRVQQLLEQVRPLPAEIVVCGRAITTSGRLGLRPSRPARSAQRRRALFSTAS